MIAYERVTTICFSWVFKRPSVIAAFLIVALLSFPAVAFDVHLGTGETGTFSHFTGRTICRAVNRHADDINCRPVSAAGDMHNLTNLQDGSLDIGLIDSRMLYDAVNNAGYFEFLDIRYDNLRALLPLYDVPVTLVVRKDAKITSLDALAGKRLNAGAPRSPEHLAFDTIMQAKNWSNKDFRLVAELPPSQSQDTMAFCHGTIQAMVHIGVHPNALLEQLFRLCKAGMVNMNDGDIEKLINGHSAYSRVKIAPDTYPSQPEGVATFGTTMVLVASGDLDEETVYKIIEAIDKNRKRLKSAHPALLSFTTGAARDNVVGVQLHPGAAKYFSEHNK